MMTRAFRVTVLERDEDVVTGELYEAAGTSIDARVNSFAARPRLRLEYALRRSLHVRKRPSRHRKAPRTTSRRPRPSRPVAASSARSGMT